MTGNTQIDPELAGPFRQSTLSRARFVELKISRFLSIRSGTYYPEDLHALIMKKVEKPLCLVRFLRRTGGNQVHASKILGINRNTLRKKMKLYGFSV